MRVPRSPNPRSRRPLAALAGGALTLSMVAAGVATTAARRGSASAAAAAAGLGAAGLAGGHKARDLLQFDNVHYSRDNPDVPSDLEQMPNLLHFLTGNGTLISHEHTPLIAHTADDIVTSETGLYGSDQGCRSRTSTTTTPRRRLHATPPGRSPTGPTRSWTTTPASRHAGRRLQPDAGRRRRPNAPAPWAPYTRAGLRFRLRGGGGHRTGEHDADVPLRVRRKLAQAKEAENPKLQNKAAADYEGLAVHCAQGSAACASAARSPTRCPMSPAVTPATGRCSAASTSTRCHQPVRAGTQSRRPGHQGLLRRRRVPRLRRDDRHNALAYTLDMQTHGVPVTYTYLSDLHDSWTTGAASARQARTRRSSGRTRPSARSSPTWPRTASPRPTRCSWSPPTRATTSSAARQPRMQRRQGRLHVQKVGEVDGNLTGMLGRGATPPPSTSRRTPRHRLRAPPARPSIAPVRALERRGEPDRRRVATGRPCG